MCSNQPGRARHLYAYKWLVTHQPTPAEDVLDIFISTSTTGSSCFRQNKQKRNTFSVLPVHRITTNDNPQPGFVQQKPASTCNAERHLPSSAPGKGRTTDNVDHCSHRRALQRFDEVTRSDPVTSCILDSSPSIGQQLHMHRPWNLEFHLWTTAENLTTEDVTGGKINGIKTHQKEAGIREKWSVACECT